MKPQYSVQIAWSTEDNAYLAIAVELPGCVADGASQEEALNNLNTIVEQWLEVATAEHRPIPQALTIQDHEQNAAKFQQAVHEYIQNAVENAVQGVIRQIAEQRQDAWGTPTFRGVPLVHHGER